VTAKQFYEVYWQQDYAPPQSDPTTAERMVRLESNLRPLILGHRNGGCHVLDAGCGDGAFLVFLRRLGVRVTGVELAEAAAAQARRRCPEADVQIASLEEPLPFDNGTFDAVWLTDVLEHLFDVRGALGELHRVLKRRGLLMLTTPYHGLVKNLLIALAGFEGHYDPEGGPIRFFTRRSLDRCLRGAGFVPEIAQVLGHVWPVWKSVFVVARKADRPRSAEGFLE
jgi:2-polyprenyl-6-hydroxyphenyl methylase/3-demethylubiquinone-9 3-methyltransferase